MCISLGAENKADNDGAHDRPGESLGVSMTRQRQVREQLLYNLDLLGKTGRLCEAEQRAAWGGPL